MNSKQVVTLAARRDQNKRQAEEAVQDTIQVQNEDVGIEEEPVPSETELSEQMAEAALR